MRALDLFCCAGGASMGLHRAGFEVTGVDINPQPRYPFKFIQGDALTVPLDDYDLIWASPPCQAHSSMKHMHNAKSHPDLIPPMRERLRARGGWWIMENVVGAPLRASVMLCGTMFGLGAGDAELRRHRLFEMSHFFLDGLECRHERPRVIGIYGGHGRDRRRAQNTQNFTTAERREAMGIDWMTGKELCQSIPPAYSEYLARQFLNSR